tara:strand:- start:124 stop:279 length:156 start_codon:yes stop_codon:yes gene_type:complete
MNYDDLAEIVNKIYRETGDIRATCKRLKLPFFVVYEMTGHKDVDDFGTEGG